uniref:Uncharacterized protein LOC102807800 n=1 Tax=Saccoglossus kowalevskii TaxID=10224 RepID=A0ABM0MF24_SACKO|nr:PREDICTED: uncharacterized protein LOC102807800 [Saccoglossus kowalevskii]
MLLTAKVICTTVGLVTVIFQMFFPCHYLKQGCGFDHVHRRITWLGFRTIIVSRRRVKMAERASLAVTTEMDSYANAALCGQEYFAKLAFLTNISMVSQLSILTTNYRRWSAQLV